MYEERLETFLLVYWMRAVAMTSAHNEPKVFNLLASAGMKRGWKPSSRVSDASFRHVECSQRAKGFKALGGSGQNKDIKKQKLLKE